MAILTNIISAEIKSDKSQFDGRTLTRPTLIALDGLNRTYVVDVDVGQKHPLRNVPIAAADGTLRYADVGAAVRLTRSPSGKFEVTGFSKRMPGTYITLPVSIPVIDFSPQLVYDGTAVQNAIGPVVVGTPTQVGITTRALSYEELATFGGYGNVPYGAIALYENGVFKEIIQ